MTPERAARWGHRALAGKQENQRAPNALAPVELVVMALLCFFPLVLRQPRFLQFFVGEGLFLNEVLKSLAVLPADAAQFLDDGDRVPAAIVIPGEVNRAAVEIEPGRFCASVVRFEDLLDEVPFLNLERAGEAGRGAEGFRVLPRKSDTANAAHR